MVYKIIIALIIVGGLGFYFYPEKKVVQVPIIPEPIVETQPTIPDITVLETGLNIPWDIAVLEDGSYLITERVGNLLHIKDGVKKVIKLPHPIPKGEGGLLGIALHPHFVHNNLIYILNCYAQNVGVARFRVDLPLLLESGAGV
jgi:glucose/arabinose dehydrogenase